jgi:hypothetical protein
MSNGVALVRVPLPPGVDVGASLRAAAPEAGGEAVPLAHGAVAVLPWLLRLATAGACIGHGAYGAVMAKPGWYPFLAQLGLVQAAVDDPALLRLVGGSEMLMGVLALVRRALGVDCLGLRRRVRLALGQALGRGGDPSRCLGQERREFLDREGTARQPTPLLGTLSQAADDGTLAPCPKMLSGRCSPRWEGDP